jgi:deoxyribonuclease-4
MLNIGCHLSCAKGYLAMGRAALSIGASTCQFFTRNPRGGAAKAADPADAAAFLALAREHGLGPFLAHAPYTMNPCAAEEKTRAFALQAMREDLQRLTLLPGCLYNFHPGSHVGQGVEAGIAGIAAQLDAVLTPEGRTLVLLETMAGKGSEVGGRFAELRAIIDRVALPERLGVCLDTCHVHDAGYDIVGDLDGVLAEFDRVVGLGRLRAVHLNDSLNPRGSRKDRHAKIGQGHIGLAAMGRVVDHPALRGLPFYLETPNELPGYAEEIALLRGLRRK